MWKSIKQKDPKIAPTVVYDVMPFNTAVMFNAQRQYAVPEQRYQLSAALDAIHPSQRLKALTAYQDAHKRSLTLQAATILHKRRTNDGFSFVYPVNGKTIHPYMT